MPESIPRQPNTSPLQYLETEEGFHYEPSLEQPIMLDAFAHEKDLHSPTPLDPFNISANGVEYFDAALELMLGRFRENAGRVSLDDEARQKIESEIEIFHRNRCTKNMKGLNRLRDAVYQYPERVTDELRQIFERVRSAQGTLPEKLRLLETFPEMKSVGGIQYTEPLRNDVLQPLAIANLGSVMNRLHEAGIRFDQLDENYSIHDPRQNVEDLQPRNYANLDDAIAQMALLREAANHYPFVIFERALLRIHLDNVVVEMGEIRNPYITALDQPLENLPGTVVRIPRKGEVNSYDIAYATYYRVVPPEMIETPFQATYGDLHFADGTKHVDVARRYADKDTAIDDYL